ncbi:MSP domain protein 2 [Aphelenchoides avenae]|nr:MSP domain protein 2 [Aphelenchus avenae]
MENRFLLSVEPRDRITFVGNAMGEIHTQIQLKNTSNARQAFKVKCTRNDLFRIRPSTGILDYNESTTIDITYRSNGQPPDNGRHHFGFYHIPAPEGSTAVGVWSEHHGPAQGELRMRAYFEGR